MRTTATLFRGATVHDPEATGPVVRDVAMAGSTFVDVDSLPGEGVTVVDASGLLLTPGLVDLHTHVFSGQDLGAPIDSFAAAAGTTAVVDAGSAGGHLIGAFRRAVSDVQGVQIAALLNVSSIGTTSILLQGELSPAYADTELVVETVERHRELLVGVKVRASGNVGGAFTSTALRRARAAADRLALPLMVHLGPAPAEVDEILGLLRAGDVLTHACTGWPGNSLVDPATGGVRRSGWEARERGVLFDVGHGMSGFSFEVAERMLEVGFAPDTISSDLHAYSRTAVVDLPTVLAKFLAIGMPLHDVVRAATCVPAAAVGRPWGTLRQGARADLALFELVEGEVGFDDGFGGRRTAQERLETALTVSGGRIVHSRDAAQRGTALERTPL